MQDFGVVCVLVCCGASTGDLLVIAWGLDDIHATLINLALWHYLDIHTRSVPFSGPFMQLLPCMKPENFHHTAQESASGRFP